MCAVLALSNSSRSTHKRTYELIALDLIEILKKIKTDFYFTIFVQTSLILFPFCRV